jgi:lysyl-tRNA synthetase class 2
MEPEPRAPDDERAARLARVDAMRARGEDPYPVRFDRTHTLAVVREHWDDRVEPGATSNDVVRIAGRVAPPGAGQTRVRGLRDGTGSLQLFVNKAEPATTLERFVSEVERGTGSVSKAR